MVIIQKVTSFLFRESRIWRNWRLKKSWRNKTKPYINKRFSLTEAQQRNMHSIWDKYVKIDDFYHAFYTDKTGVFHATYLPDDLYYSVIDRFYNNKELALWLDDKSLYERLFRDPEIAIKFPDTIAIKSGGHWVDPIFNPITYNHVMDRIMAAGEIFVKISTDSCGGKGVKYINTQNVSQRDIDEIINQMGDNVVIQKKILQSPILSSLNPSSVNTIRLISLLKADGEVKIYSVVLRIGINGSVVDNASSGGITVGVKKDGQLKSSAYTAQGRRYEKYHPDTRIEFDTVRIPGIENIKTAIIQLHHKLPRLRLLSWDIALDQNNDPVLIEVNMNRGQLDFHQFNNGPLFGDDTEEILSEVFLSGGG